MKALVFTLLCGFTAAAMANPPPGHPTMPPPGHPSVSEAAEAMGLSQFDDQANLPNKGTVVSTIHSNSYTYIEVDMEGGKRWLAAPRVALNNGSVIRFDEGNMMKDFYSKKQKRTFPEVYFVGGVQLVKE